MITGSLYNPKRLYPAKANQYLSGFVSQTPNRQGSNSILFNDTNGKEQIEITTTGNKIETIEKDHTVNIDGSQKVTIGQNQETTINESQHTHIKQNQETKVEGSQITKVTGDIKITSTEGSIELYSKKTSIIESDDSVYLNAKKKIVLRAGTGITLKVGGNHITLDPANLTTFPMMGLSGEVPPFASVAASSINVADGNEATNTSINVSKIESIHDAEDKMDKVSISESTTEKSELNKKAGKAYIQGEKQIIRHQLADLRMEGLAPHGSYHMTVNHVVEGRGLLVSVFIDVSFLNSPLLPNGATVTAIGSLELIVDDKITGTYPLSKDGNNVLPENSLYAGSVNLMLPDPNKVQKIQINISGGYQIFSYIGSMAPSPARVTEKISIDII